MTERGSVLELARAAESALDRNRARIDDLNVYPVPDGDTGTNMAAVEKLVHDIRPNAEIEVATTLGPVVGTHAGPGTVGLFWLQD